MTGSGFAIAESIVFILMLFCPRSVIFCRSDRPRPIDAGGIDFRESGDRRGAKKARFCCALRFRRGGQKKCKVLLRDLSRAVRSSSSSPTGC